MRVYQLLESTILHLPVVSARNLVIGGTRNAVLEKDPMLNIAAEDVIRAQGRHSSAEFPAFFRKFDPVELRSIEGVDISNDISDIEMLRDRIPEITMAMAIIIQSSQYTRLLP
jgi:hypothetical protein